MNLAFLRNIDKGTLIYVMQRLLGAMLPMKPYPQCGYTQRCPCPAAQQCVTGVALGNEVTMNLGDQKSCPHDRKNLAPFEGSCLPKAD